MRDSLIKSISKENDPAQITSLRIDYKKLWNEITKEKRDNKKEYYAKYFENNKRKSSETWKGIRALVNIKSTKFSNIKLLDKNKNLISDSKKIASIFNNHFSTIGSKIPFHPGNFKDYLNKKDKNGKLFVNSTNTLFFLSPSIPKEVEKIIDALDVKKVNRT